MVPPLLGAEALVCCDTFVYVGTGQQSQEFAACNRYLCYAARVVLCSAVYAWPSFAAFVSFQAAAAAIQQESKRANKQRGMLCIAGNIMTNGGAACFVGALLPLLARHTCYTGRAAPTGLRAAAGVYAAAAAAAAAAAVVSLMCPLMR
jgi:hypothetical protein